MNSDFWLNPPWDGKNKHRLGLHPVALGDIWVDDVDLLSNKKRQLREQYYEVIATHSGYEGYQWQLPGIAEPDPSYPDWIAQVGSVVAEDVCILDATDNNRLVAGCLAAPSYWSLKDKMGQPLHDVHGPVEGMNEKIGDRISGFFAGMPVNQPFRRQNWFVHGEAVYFRQSPNLRTQLSAHPEDWIFRSERQTLIRLDERFVLFVIGIVFTQFVELRNYPDALQSFKASLAAMDEDETTHFGGLEKFAKITNYVDSL